VPIVPKWFCWYSIWVAFVFFTELIMPFFKAGIFAWDGLVNYWVGFFAWFFWIIGQSYYAFAAISRLELEAKAPRAAAAPFGAAGIQPAA
jgi:hypothetical protein